MADISTGLTGYWKFDENSGSVAADSSGNGRAGILTSSPQWTGGYTNTDLNFNGTSNYVHIDYPLSSFIGTATGTVSGWVYAYGGTGSGANGACGNVFTDGNNASGGYMWFCVASDDKIYVGGYDGGNKSVGVSATPYYNTWTHVAWVHTDGNVSLYINGNLAGTTPLGNIASLTTNATISRSYNGAAFFNGKIDEVRTYNRALTTTDINQLYYCTAPSSGDWVIDGNTRCETWYDYDQNIVGYWAFDEGSGITAVDSSGNGNTGTLNNGASWASGKIGAKSLSLAGDGDVVDVGSGASLDNLPVLTYAGWVYVASATGNKMIVDKGGRKDFRVNANLSVLFSVEHATTALTKQSSASAVPLNSWTHVAVSWDGTTSASGAHIYVNGVETGYAISGDASGAVESESAYNQYIGDYIYGGMPFNGSLDDIRIYNRVLSATDVNNLYKETRVIGLNGNLDIRNGSLAIGTGDTILVQSGKKVLIRRKPTDTDNKLTIQRPGSLMVRK